MIKKAKKILGLFCTCALIALNVTPVFALNANEPIIDEFGHEVIETPVEIECEVVKTPVENKPNIGLKDFDPFHSHSHRIENVSKCRINTFIPLTAYVRNDYAKNESGWPSATFEEGESFTISAGFNTAFSIKSDVVEEQIGFEIGTSQTMTASRTYSFPVPYGYAGRVVYRYSYDYATFDCIKEYHDGTIEKEKGSAESDPIGGASSYFALQKYYVF